jgi:hypothetical protein
MNISYFSEVLILIDSQKSESEIEISKNHEYYRGDKIACYDMRW